MKFGKRGRKEEKTNELLLTLLSELPLPLLIRQRPTDAARTLLLALVGCQRSDETGLRRERLSREVDEGVSDAASRLFHRPSRALLLVDDALREKPVRVERRLAMRLTFCWRHRREAVAGGRTGSGAAGVVAARDGSVVEVGLAGEGVDVGRAGGGAGVLLRREGRELYRAGHGDAGDGNRGGTSTAVGGRRGEAGGRRRVGDPSRRELVLTRLILLLFLLLLVAVDPNLLLLRLTGSATRTR